MLLNDEPDELQALLEKTTKRTKSVEMDRFRDTEEALDAFSQDSYDLTLVNKNFDSKEVASQMKKLRPDEHSIYLAYQESGQKRGTYARTFGQFDLFVNGKAVHFNRAKSKEVMAYLIDRRGGGVTRREIATVIFEDSQYTKNIQDYMGKIIRDLENTLAAEGISDLLIKSFNRYAVDTEKLRCDFYDYMNAKDKTAVEVPFCGEYMNQYSWSEDTIGALYFGNDDWDE